MRCCQVQDLEYLIRDDFEKRINIIKDKINSLEDKEFTTISIRKINFLRKHTKNFYGDSYPLMDEILDKIIDCSSTKNIDKIIDEILFKHFLRQKRNLHDLYNEDLDAKLNSICEIFIELKEAKKIEVFDDKFEEEISNLVAKYSNNIEVLMDIISNFNEIKK